MALLVVLALFAVLAILGLWLGVDSRVPGGWHPRTPTTSSGPTGRRRPIPPPDRPSKRADTDQPARLLSTDELSILSTPPSRTRR